MAMDKGDFPHFMLKEIFEQPAALRDTVAPRLSPEVGRILLEEIGLSHAELQAVRKINIVGSGTSRHAGMAGMFMLLELAGLPVEVDYASEFEYRNPCAGPGELTIVITQSGETADSIGALRVARARGSRTLALCNVVGSTIAHEADGVLYTRAGPEISVASTKSFTTQMAALFLFALFLAQLRDTVPQKKIREYIRELLELPAKLEGLLTHASDCRRLAEEYHQAQDFLFLGRAIHYPIAMDGALKLKEVSYIHAEGYPAGETKHGPNALIDQKLPVVILSTCDRNDRGSLLRYQKTLANLKGIKAQSARVIAIASEGEGEISALADHTLFVPSAPELLLPILEIVPLQLFAYYMAVRRGCDVDQPRNLVKSVTEE
jgi:glucosamine--fructose-6-phosphate aminotransferase (isomerizing)